MANNGALYTNGTASGQITTGASKVFGVVVNSHSSGTIRFNDGLSGTTSAGVKATGVLTGTDVFSDGETITIENITYTMRTALSSPAVPREVLIGASLADSLDNLKVAINGGAGEGTTYSTGTEANPNVTATTNTDTAQTVEAKRVGTYANSFATTETADNASWGAVVLESGADASLLVTDTFTVATGSQVITFPEPILFNTGAYLTVGGTIDYTVLHK